MDIPIRKIREAVKAVVKRKFMGVEDPQDLPAGFKERMDRATHVISDEAERVMNIVEEFACNSMTIKGNGIKVTIERIDD